MDRARFFSVICLAVAGAAGSTGCGDDDSGPCSGVEGTCIAVEKGATVGEAQRALIQATPGSTVAFAAGKFTFNTGLSLDVDDVRIIGAGMEKTVLSFAGQADGAQGLLVTSDDFVLEDIAFEDTEGDAVKVEGANRVIIRSTRVEWTAGANSENGSYGLYPVQCKNVLVEDSVVIGASDAGIYVGQSENVVVRRNRVEKNVAGIEIENCKKSDVYENVATGNTGGILVFNLPNLPVGNGLQTRVYKNEIYSNNEGNFAPPGNIVGVVPAGTGVVVLASRQAEIFDNTIRDNKTTNVGIVSYKTLDIAYTDANYDPYPTAIYIHDNRISGTSDGANGSLGALVQLTLPEVGINSGIIPDVVWDGMMDATRVVGGDYPAADKLCFRANGDADFLNLQFPPGAPPLASQSLTANDCTHTPLPAVTLEGI